MLTWQFWTLIGVLGWGIVACGNTLTDLSRKLDLIYQLLIDIRDRGR